MKNFAYAMCAVLLVLIVLPAQASAAVPTRTVATSETFAVLRSSMLRYVITSKEDVATVAPLATRSDPAALVAWMRAALTLDLTPQRSAIRVPFTEIVPFDSTIDPYRGFPSLDAKRRAYTTWISHARDGKVIMIDHSRHFVMFDQPQVYTGALVDQVSRMSGL